MSTGETTAAAPVAEKYTKEQAATKFGSPADGFRYMVKDGVVVIGVDGKPIQLKKKVSKGRNKPTRPKFVVPVGKLQSADVVGYDADIHARLKMADFVDPVHFHEHEVKYYESKLATAKKAVDNMRALGGTPEERRAALDKEKLVSSLEKLAKSGGLNAALAERLGIIFANAEATK